MKVSEKGNFSNIKAIAALKVCRMIENFNGKCTNSHNALASTSLI